jgi:ribonuclease D
VRDIFGPLSDPPSNYITLPSDVRVEVIDSVVDIPKLDVLLSEPYIGVDSEWRPSLTKFHTTYPALFQISGAKDCFLIDFVAFRDSPHIDEKLTQIFTNPKSTIVGFSFSSDVSQFAKKFPRLKFYRYAARFIDAQTYYSRVCTAQAQTGLAKVAEKIMGKAICKREQMSNWERRPLRNS